MCVCEMLANTSHTSWQMGCSVLKLDTVVTESGPAWRISGHLCNLDEGCLCVSGAASDLPGILRFTRFSFFQLASLLLSLKWFKFCLSLPIFFFEKYYTSI